MKVRNYMAIIRNIRNIIEAGVDEKHMSKVLRAISNPEAVRKSKQLPFRFLSAYNAVGDNAGSKILDTLETAADYSIENLPKIPGKTVIAVDVSGSMRSQVSAKSDVTCAEIAILLGMIANRICEDSIFYTFDDKIEKQNVSHRNGVLYATTHTRINGGATYISLPFKKMIDDNVKADRIIVLSDNQCNGGWGSKPVQSIADEYRRTTGNDIWVHAIDLQGYGTQQFHGAKTNIVAGWSEKVFDFIALAEQGEGTLEKRIAEYRW